MKGKIDRQRVLEKLAYLEEQLADLAQLAQEATEDTLAKDPWKGRGVRYALQTAIEAIIDIVYHVAAKGYSHAPADARDAVQYLARQGVFPESEAEVLTQMIRFRNRLVHGYDRVDNHRLWEIITGRLSDFDLFKDRILQLLQRVP